MSCKEISALHIGLAKCLGNGFLKDVEAAKSSVAELIEKEPEIKAVAEAENLDALIEAFDGIVAAVKKRVESTPEDDAHLSYRKALLLTVHGLAAQLKSTKCALDSLRAGIDSVHAAMNKVYEPHPHH